VLNRLIEPKGAIEKSRQKFIGVFYIRIADDGNFCLVKRILGKDGCNMKRISNATGGTKLRLRGLGSGFLEGSACLEAKKPLELNVCSNNYEDYVDAVFRAELLLKGLDAHHHRYLRSRGYHAAPTASSIDFRELRRDDLGLDVLTARSRRTPRERIRDSRARREEHRTKCPGTSLSQMPAQCRTAPDTLPGEAYIPTTPAGRRAAREVGGAEAAAVASAAARALHMEAKSHTAAMVAWSDSCIELSCEEAASPCPAELRRTTTVMQSRVAKHDSTATCGPVSWAAKEQSVLNRLSEPKGAIEKATEEEGVEARPPWLAVVDGWDYCRLCSLFATDEHLQSRSHLRKVQWHNSATDPSEGPPQTWGNPDHFELREGFWRCRLCRKWADDCHIESKHHAKQVAWSDSRIEPPC